MRPIDGIRSETASIGTLFRVEGRDSTRPEIQSRPPNPLGFRNPRQVGTAVSPFHVHHGRRSNQPEFFSGMPELKRLRCSAQAPPDEISHSRLTRGRFQESRSLRFPAVPRHNRQGAYRGHYYMFDPYVDKKRRNLAKGPIQL